MTQQYILYTTLGCHLCEQALSLWQTCMPDESLFLVDIAEHDYLMDQYGVRIPVIKSNLSQQELSWPFNEQDIYAWVTQSQF